MIASQSSSSTVIAIEPHPGGFFKDGALSPPEAEASGEHSALSAFVAQASEHSREDQLPVITSDGQRFALVGAKVDQAD